MQTQSLNHRPLKLAALSGILLLSIGGDLAFGEKSKLSFEDKFNLDDTRHYEVQGGEWTYDSSNKRFAMAPVLKTANESMWAIRADATVPRAFTFEADFTSTGKDGTVALALKNPDTGDHALANVSFLNDDVGGWWVTAWIIYSYTDAKWGFHEQVKKHMTQPPLAGSTFHLVLTRQPGSNTLEFLVQNIDLGMLETSLAPDSTPADDPQSIPLTPAWLDALNGMTRVGVFGYSCEGAWDNITLKSLEK